MGVFRLLARQTIGLLFMGHGTQKLFGWFGGGGPEESGRFFEQVGLRPGGVWSTGGGYEYNLVLLAAVFGLTENGPGRWSVDGTLGRRRWGTGWALAALAAGAAGSAAVLAGAEREGQNEAEAEHADTARDAAVAVLVSGNA
jgi:putative oxidoreductase